ncbi:unnamed protein product [Pleuronectes platessa]|uniref:Sterile alpha motif domain containing 3 n=1 Tax=Pleuronectes platessa TaxID=8262 RepID=A0A9N7VVG2_PLEPL|nr:unnamed protein product [Pleuronectes platessa]
MILTHGSLGGLPEFSEIIPMVILQDKLIFIVKKLSGWYASCFIEKIHSCLKDCHGWFNACQAQDKEYLGLEGNIRVQYMDPDFGNDFFNLNSTTELQDLGTIKVIQQRTNPPSISAIETTSSQSLSIESDDSFSAGSHDTVLLSSPESVSSRKQQLPAAFPLPRFSYDTELQLEKGNSEYHVSLKILTLTSRMKSDILNRLAEEIFKYKAYPEDAHFCTVAEALIKKYPCLKEPGSFNGCYGWKQRLKYKMGNFRTEIAGVSRATLESLEKERLELLRQVVIRNNERVIADKMALTFAYRRQEIINKEPSLNDFKNRWPALFQRREINAEFQRLMAVPLEEKFMAKLDLNSSELMRVIRKKGGATRQRLAGIIQTMDQTEDINLRRESLLKALVIFLGEDPDDLIKEYLDSSADKDLDQLTMAIVVIRKLGQGGQEPPEDISIVIEGVEVLSGLNSVASACALLLGYIYAINLAYPKQLHYTFEALQKIIMQLDHHKMSQKDTESSGQPCTAHGEQMLGE